MNDTSTPSEEAIAQTKQEGKEPKTKYRHVCIKGINFKPDPELLKEMNREATSIVSIQTSLFQRKASIVAKSD